MPKRRIAIAGGIVAAVAVVLGALTWLWWIPSAVDERVRDAAARRGLEASIASVGIGFGSVTLSGVRLVGGDGALTVDVGEIDTGAGVFALATEGTAAIRRLLLRDVRVGADLDADGLVEALRDLRGEAATEDEGARGGRAVTVEGIEVELRDGEGTVLAVQRGRLSLLPEGILRVTTGAIDVAPGAADGVSADRASLRAERGDEGWRVSAATLSDTEVRYAEREGEERSPLWSRLRRHAGLASSLVEGAEAGAAEDEASVAMSRRAGTDEAGDDATGGDETGAQPTRAGAEEGTGATGDDDATGDEAADDGLAAGGDDDARAAGGDDEVSTSAVVVRVLQAMGPRLAPDGLLRLDGLTVTARAGDDERTVLRDLEAEVRALSEGRYRLEGSGRPGRGGGRLGWDLEVDPADLRAQGRLDFQRLPFVLITPFLPRLPWHHPEDTRLSGELSVTQENGGASSHLVGQVTIEDLALSSPRIAPSPVQRIAIRMSGEASWLPLERRLQVERLEMGLGQASANVTGTLEWPEDHYRIDVRATLPPTDCNVAVGAIPADLLGDAAAFTFTGQIGGRVVAQIDSRDLDETELDIHVANGCVFETAPGMADVSRFRGPFTHRVVEPDGTHFEMETGPGTLQWTPIEQISPFFVHAVLGHEDAGFFHHSGFSEGSIRVALIRNLRAGRYAFGASTITMQLVKNVFLHREKTLARKVQEVILTWWTESAMSKEEILELYLNVIEYGPQVYGIRSAAMHYFGRTPADLGPAESAYLATILPNPKAFHSQWQQDALPESHRRRTARFIQTLRARNRYDDAAAEHAIERLGDFDFHHPDEPLPPEPERRGQAAPLPFGSDLDRAWDEAMGMGEPEDDSDEMNERD